MEIGRLKLALLVGAPIMVILIGVASYFIYSSLNEQQRIAAYRDIQVLLADRGPVIIPYYFAQFGAISDQFDGFELKAFAGRTDFRDVSLAE